MALTCGMSLNTYAVTAGQSPGAMATLTVYNPNASAVVVTGAALTFRTLGQTQPNPSLAINPPSVPIGPGQTVSVPALGSINIGPFPIQMAMPANSSSYNSLGPVGTTLTGPSQLALPSQEQIIISALVQGSDGSQNVAADVGLTVSYYTPPPLHSQGGVLQFYRPKNFITGLTLGLL